MSSRKLTSGHPDPAMGGVIYGPWRTRPQRRALDVLPLRPGRTEGRRRLSVVDPRRHKPDSAKGPAPRGPVQPIGPANSKRAPAKRRKAAQEAATPPMEDGQHRPTCAWYNCTQ